MTFRVHAGRASFGCFSIALLLAVVAVYLVPASALGAYVLKASFGSSGSGDGQVQLAATNFPAGIDGSGLVVNQETGGIYVTDTGNHRVIQFSSTGTFIRAFGADVGGPGVDVCTSGCVAGTSESSPGAFEDPTFVAIDNSPGGVGDVYVADTADDLITKFEADGTLVSAWGSGGQLDGSDAIAPPEPFAGPFGEIVGIAVDSVGNLNVLENTEHALFRFAPDSTFLTDFETPRGSAPGGLVVDPDGNFFKINGAPSVEKFESSGADVGQVTKAEGSTGLAVDPSSGELFVGRGGSIDIYTFEPSGEVVGTGCTPAPLEEGIFEGCPPTSTFGAGGLTSGAGLAVDGATHTVYAADPAADAIRAFASVEIPEAATEAATEVAPISATLNGAVNPNGVPLTECFFRWGETKSYGNTIPCEDPDAAEVGEGTEAVPVQAELPNLSVGTTYHFKLVAVNASGSSEAEESAKEDEEFRTFGPTIEAETVSQVTATGTQIAARVNPNGEAASFFSQYVTEAQFQANEYEEATPVPLTPRDLGSGTEFEDVVQQIGGLTPQTTYHLRLVAVGAAATAFGPDKKLTTFALPRAGLPDERRYEMISPPQKTGEVLPPEPSSPSLGGSCGDCLPGVNVAVRPMQAAPSGEAALYEGQPFSGGLAAGPNEYISGRGTAEWSTQSLSPPAITGRYQAFSSDLSRGILSQGNPPLSPQAPTRGGESFPNLYLRTQGGAFTPLVSAEPPNRQPFEFDITYAGANSGAVSAPEFSHLVFEADDALTAAVLGIAPAAPEVEEAGECIVASSCDLYEWQDGQLRLVNVLPDKTAAGEAMIASGRLLTEATAEYEAPNVDHAISADGSKIFWSSEESGQVYARVDGVKTFPVSGPASCKESVTLENRACFLTASADGSEILLSDGGIYEIDEEAEAYKPVFDLSDGEGGFKGILGASEDLSHVYFIDTAALTEGEENANHEQAKAGRPNLYAWSEGDSSFIGVLLGTDNQFGSGARYGDWKASRPNRTAQVSPDGRFLAFMTRARLSEYDNTVSEGGNCSGSCREVFLYRADPGTLVCASCNPSGERPIGPSNLSLLRPDGPPFPQPGNLSDAGEGRLFFESQDALSPQDTNGRVQDIYEWEPDGVGNCQEARGCVSLISSGQSANDSMFLDSTPSGNDAFFITRQRLLQRDQDDQLDLYDARVGGGFEEPLNPVCDPEACSGSISPPPAFQSAASSAFNGSGNAPSPKSPCKPGFHRKHGKCVKKKHHKKRSARHNRGGAK